MTSDRSIQWNSETIAEIEGDAPVLKIYCFDKKNLVASKLAVHINIEHRYEKLVHMIEMLALFAGFVYRFLKIMEISHSSFNILRARLRVCFLFLVHLHFFTAQFLPILRILTILLGNRTEIKLLQGG